MQYRVRGTLDDAQEFTFTVEAPQFIAATSAAANLLASKLGARAGQVVSCKISLLAAVDGDFKLRSADKRAKAVRNVPATAPATVAAAPIPATASQKSGKQK